MNWMQTRDGKKWSLLAPRTSDVDFLEIAHALANIPRFLGHTSQPISVAEHCVRVHDWLVQRNHPAPICLLGLLHDAHEAFIGDITTPVKTALICLAEESTVARGGDLVRGILKDLAARQDDVIFAAVGLRTMMRRDKIDWNLAKALVKEADKAALLAERDATMVKSPEPWVGYEVADVGGIKVQCWSPAEAYFEFLSRLAPFIHEDDEHVTAAE
jgi:5'-deoxynucleotidase YfbR-like HD superfamily hydrolase